MKSFNERCYALLRRVPRGKVTTYKAIAHALNCKAYRAVGQAMNKNPCGFWAAGRSSLAKRHDIVPCHRVIASDGSIGGFAHGVKRKIALLRREGIEIKNGTIDLARFGYSPIYESLKTSTR